MSRAFSGPLETMPPIPTDWEDISWMNDACPSFSTPGGKGWNDAGLAKAF